MFTLDSPIILKVGEANAGGACHLEQPVASNNTQADVRDVFAWLSYRWVTSHAPHR
jgi:hypothetical protein